MAAKLSGILLAGGKSSRMGTDKAFVPYHNKELFRYSLEILQASCNDICISSSNPDFKSLNYTISKDEIPGLGPIGGIYSALKKTKNEYSLILSCDTPFVPLTLIHLLIKNTKDDHIICGLNSDNKPEPLVGIYHKKCLLSIENQIKQGNLRMSHLLKEEKTRFIKLPYSKAELDYYFSNINTKNDLNNINHG